MTATEVPGRSAIVLVIDRLGAGWLGPYGNSWLDTPNFNRLAARSVLCDTVIADTADLAVGYRGFWTGQHAMQPDGARLPSLADAASAAGLHAALVTDDPHIVVYPQAAGFGQRQLLPDLSRRTAAEAIEQTALYSFFDAARTALQEQKRPFLLWLHARGMTGPWDAPLELRYQFADEEDPDPPSFVQPPNLLLPQGFDPDQLLGFVHAYAGQVALADMCLGMLLDCLADHSLASETTLIVTSPRGYPLGEHRRIGPCDEALYGELLHVPLMVQFPDYAHALTRTGRIMQPGDVYSLLANAQTSSLVRELTGSEPTTAHNLACATGPDQRAIRTPAWFLRESPGEEGPRRELFAKPDDRWEANEVSSRCGDVVELLAAELDRFEAVAREGRLSEIPPLAELLCDVWR